MISTPMPPRKRRRNSPGCRSES